MVVRDHKALLIQRNHEPGKGLWTIPGGFVEFDETAEVGVVREVLEETGIESKVWGLVAFRSRVNPKNNDSYAVFLLEYQGGEFIPTPNDEVADIGFFSLEELETLSPLPPVSKQLAQRAIQGRLQVLQGQFVPRWNSNAGDLVFMGGSDE